MTVLNATKIINKFRLLNSNAIAYLIANRDYYNSQNIFLCGRFNYLKNTSFSRTVMNLSSVIKNFEEIVPKHLAEKWDNTGLLIEPEENGLITTIFFTNDLTEDVLEEALSFKTNLIISYHPPIFTGFKALLLENWKDRIVMKCIANKIAVYSPHTACDAIRGGVNDWLIKCFDFTDIRPIKHTDYTQRCILECLMPKELQLTSILNPELNCEVIMTSEHQSDRKLVKIASNAETISKIHQIISTHGSFQLISVTDCKLINSSSQDGMGRIGKLNKPMKLNDCIKVMKNHVKLPHLRIAIGTDCALDTEICTIACCAGSGASLLRNVPADLYITGEMSHHDLLDAQHRKTSVILCEHSNSERGYLKDLSAKFATKLQGVNVVVSLLDKDPIMIL